MKIKSVLFLMTSLTIWLTYSQIDSAQTLSELMREQQSTPEVQQQTNKSKPVKQDQNPLLAWKVDTEGIVSVIQTENGLEVFRYGWKQTEPRHLFSHPEANVSIESMAENTLAFRQNGTPWNVNLQTGAAQVPIEVQYEMPELDGEEEDPTSLLQSFQAKQSEPGAALSLRCLTPLASKSQQLLKLEMQAGEVLQKDYFFEFFFKLWVQQKNKRETARFGLVDLFGCSQIWLDRPFQMLRIADEQLEISLSAPATPQVQSNAEAYANFVEEGRSPFQYLEVKRDRLAQLSQWQHLNLQASPTGALLVLADGRFAAWGNYQQHLHFTDDQGQMISWPEAERHWHQQTEVQAAVQTLLSEN